LFQKPEPIRLIASDYSINIALGELGRFDQPVKSRFTGRMVGMHRDVVYPAAKALGAGSPCNVDDSVAVDHSQLPLLWQVDSHQVECGL
jgi:hypothetical protein